MAWKAFAMADDDVPPRPRRERPLRAPGRDDADDAAATPPVPPTPPTVTTPPVGPPVIEFGEATDAPERDDHVVVTFDGPTTQRRWTVALRFILAIPHFLWIGLVGIAAFFVALAAWFAALFTGRVPNGMARFLSNFVQYQARVYGYTYLLLSDQYPPFALEDSDYAINVATNPGQLNRAAVFFRFILMVPGYIVSTLVLIGAQIAGVIGWLITLILGRLPTPLWEANAAVLRYQARFQAFIFLLTAEQPKALFGDATASSAPAFDELDLPERPRITRLVLSKAARRILVTFIVLTVVVYGGFITVAAIFGAQASAAYKKLDESHDRLGVAVHAFSEDVQRCAINGGLQCLHDADSSLADAFDTFAVDVEAISFPATIDASPLVGDARDCADALRRMSQAPDQTTYSAAFADYSNAAQEFDQEYSDIAYDARYDN